MTSFSKYSYFRVPEVANLAEIINIAMALIKKTLKTQ